MVSAPGESCIMWDLDRHVGVDHPWGIDPATVAAIQQDRQLRLNRTERG
jgi:hypothetical protein